MGFMNSYKRLDNLCRDMNGIGVKGYLEDMERISNGAYQVPGWKENYLELKHYRHIRNQIAHENYADEDTMCSDEDVAWVENFHQRILMQNDPLALYYKAAKSRFATKPAAPQVPLSPPYIQTPQLNKPTRKPVGCAAALLSAIAVIALVLFILFY